MTVISSVRVFQSPKYYNEPDSFNLFEVLLPIFLEFSYPEFSLQVDCVSYACKFYRNSENKPFLKYTQKRVIHKESGDYLSFTFPIKLKMSKEGKAYFPWREYLAYVMEMEVDHNMYIVNAELKDKHIKL